MSQMTIEKTVGQLVTERPARSRVFEKYGIDYCCNGKQLLEAACRAKHVALEEVTDALTAADQTLVVDEIDWTQAPMSELADHIVGTHHAYLRTELPRLEYLIGRVVRAHGEAHTELHEVAQTFAGLKEELDSHMMKEERILFPMIKQLESANELPALHCGSVDGPIGVMEHEHDNAGRALDRLRLLTNGFAIPASACNTYRAMLSGMVELEADLHRHIHKENNILFPAAASRETQLRRANS